MTVNKTPGRYAASRRPKGDDTVCVKLSITDIYKLYKVITKLTQSEEITPELKEAALAANRLVNRTRPYYRYNKRTPFDVVSKEITGNEELHSLGAVIRQLKVKAAEWRKATPSIFDEGQRK